MFDELWSEIQDCQGEIFDLDIPELREDNKFDVEEYIKGEIDYWHIDCDSPQSGTEVHHWTPIPCILKESKERHHATSNLRNANRLLSRGDW